MEKRDEKAKAPKGPGDACPGCGTPMVPHRPVVKSRTSAQGTEVPLPASEGVAQCPRCDYVLSGPVEDKPVPAGR